MKKVIKFVESRKVGTTLVEDAKMYLVNRTNFTIKKAEKVLKNAVNNFELIPFSINEDKNFSYETGFNNSDLDNLILAEKKAKFNKSAQLILSNYKAETFDVNPFSTKKYRFIGFTKTDNTPDYKYLKIIKTVINNNYTSIEDIAKIYNDVDSEELFMNFKVYMKRLNNVLKNLAEVGIISVNNFGDIIAGNTFNQYIEFTGLKV